MELMKLLAATMFAVFSFSLISLTLLGLILGPMMKKVDLKNYKIIYLFYVPLSAALLFDHVYTKENVEKYPENMKWVLHGVKYSMLILLITFPLSCFLLIKAF